MQIRKGLLKNSGSFSKILQLIFALSLFTVFASAAWFLLTDHNYSDVNTLKLLQLFQSIGVFVLPPLILAFFWSEKPLHYLQLTTKSNISDYFIVIALMIIAIPAINLLSYVNQQLILPGSLDEKFRDRNC